MTIASRVNDAPWLSSSPLELRRPLPAEGGAAFGAEFHHIRRDRRFADCVAPDSYVAAKGLAQQLLEAGSLGIVYPSVRKRKGSCIACFRPTLVMNVRKATTFVFRWDGKPQPTIAAAK